MNAEFRENARHGDADRENGRLCIFSQSKILFRTFKNQFRQGEAERFIRFGKGVRGYGKSFSQAVANSLVLEIAI